MRLILLILLMYSCSTSEQSKNSSISFEVKSINLNNQFKNSFVDSLNTLSFDLINGDRIKYVNNAGIKDDLVYQKKQFGYAVKILYSAPINYELDGTIIIKDDFIYMKVFKKNNPATSKGLCGHIVVFEVKTKIKDPIFRNYQ